MIRLLVISISILLVLHTGSTPASSLDDMRDGARAMQRADWGEAVEIYSRAIESRDISPTNLASAYANRAGCYVYLNKPIKALADYSRFFELAPSTKHSDKHIGKAYEDRATAYIKFKDFHLAAKDADRAVKLNPNSYRGYYLGGLAREKLGRRDSAISDYKAVLRLKPGHQASTNALARLGANNPTTTNNKPECTLEEEVFKPLNPTAPCKGKSSDSLEDEIFKPLRE